MNKLFFSAMNRCVPFLVACLLFVSCKPEPAKLTPTESANITGAVVEMAQSISKDLSREGPAAWLTYFENVPNFFMASEGQIAFPNNDSSTSFIKNVLVKNIKKIDLVWKNMRIDPLTKNFANLAADFHEDITGASGKIVTADGYFTGVAEQTTKGWKLRNAHWSLKK